MLFFTFALALTAKVLGRKLAGIEFELPLALLAVVVGYFITPGKHSVAAFGTVGGLHMQRWGGDRYPQVVRHVAA